jgi:hypothetical protein
MPRHIKKAALAGQQEEADAKVRSTVEGIIADVANAATRRCASSASASTNGHRRAFG